MIEAQSNSKIAIQFMQTVDIENYQGVSTAMNSIKQSSSFNIQPGFESTAPVAPDETELLVENQFEFIGRHLFASYEECNLEALLDVQRLMKAMEIGIERSGASLLTTSSHQFPNGGFTALMLLSESHSSIHTYPEHRSCFIDMFTCGMTCRPEEFDKHMGLHLGAKIIHSNIVMRGSNALISKLDRRGKQ